MKKRLWSICLCTGVICLLFPMSILAKGYMGGRGDVVVSEEPTTDTGDDGGVPDTKMSDSGKLFGDLYKILRYEGGETKLVPEVDDEFNPVCRSEDNGNPGPIVDCHDLGATQYLVADTDDDGKPVLAVGGEPILTPEYAQYAWEVSETEYILVYAPYPSQCVQPVADESKWGDIDDVTGLDSNRIPLIMTYDATWKRTECEVGLVESSTFDPATGIITQTIEENFIQEGDDYYCDGILWADLVDEVHFGRLNLSRSPEAVLQAAFDEAINAINGADEISRDAAGRLLLTTDIYEEFSTVNSDDDTCEAELVKTVTKAIDSPLENLALYVKLMKDGHLVTPGDERMPIDRSEQGGIPIWKLLELSDGPSDALRPTVDIEQLSDFQSLVNVTAVDYYTYYQCYDVDGDPIESCLCEGTNPDGEATMVACTDVVSRDLQAVAACPAGKTCEGVFNGITTDGSYAPTGADFDFAAAFLAAAADKTGDIGVDMVVYLNSILDINQVVGYESYDDDGTPMEGARNYSDFPKYFDYTSVSGYIRETTVDGRGNSGLVTVLQESSTGGWNETDIDMFDNITFRNLGLPPVVGSPATNILGFTQMADDDLSIISFIHTYQIPGLR